MGERVNMDYDTKHKDTSLHLCYNIDRNFICGIYYRSFKGTGGYHYACMCVYMEFHMQVKSEFRGKNL